jgi:hypothetical protein
VTRAGLTRLRNQRQRRLTCHPCGYEVVCSCVDVELHFLIQSAIDGRRPVHVASWDSQGVLRLASGTFFARTKVEVCVAKKATRRSTSKRELIDTGRNKMYAKRSASGQFKEMDDVGRSLSADRRRKAKTSVASGQGDQGDRKRTASKKK